MAGIVREEKYIWAELGANHNKYWNIVMYDNNTVETQWGRIGDAGSSKKFPNYSVYEAERFLLRKCAEKEKKGYVKQRIINGSSGFTPNVPNHNLIKIATEQIKTNSPETLKLVEWLSKENVHNICNSTTLTYNTQSGLFSTPLGIVTADAINDARNLLTEIADFIAAKNYYDHSFEQAANRYLNIIPQIIGRRGETVQTLFPSLEAIQKQNQILDSLEGSLNVAMTNPSNPNQEIDKLFDVKLSLVEDGKVYDRIRAYYDRGRKSVHSSSYLKIDKIYEVEIAHMNKAYEEVGSKVGNVMELFHGSRVGNLLSILKSGFVIPPSNASHCTGRLYGNSVYFSDSSTKSLNYSYGYWSGTRNPHCFMFLNDVAMGKSYIPKYSSDGPYPKPGYDSVFAKAGQSGVINNEMMVYNTNQIKPKYLVECTD